MSERDWPPLDSPNWRPLLEAIEFLDRRFCWVPKTEAELKAALDSGDLLSIRVRWIGGRAVYEPLTNWAKIIFGLSYSSDNPGVFSGKSHDAQIERGLEESFDLHSIFVWWPDVLRLWGLAVAQPKPAKSKPAKSKPAKSKPAKSPTRRDSGQKASPVWEEKIAPYFDNVVKEKGPFLSFNHAYAEVMLFLEEWKLGKMDERTVERWIAKHRPHWIRGRDRA